MTRKHYDWEGIERDYRTGRFSLAQLSEMHGPDKGTIHRRAKKEGWEKDLSDAVRQRTREKISRERLPVAAQEEYDHSDDEIVERAADENAAIVRSHRALMGEWRSINDSYAALLRKQLEKGSIEVQLKTGDVADIDIPLDYVGKALNAGTQAMERVIKAERQSYGLDDEDGNEGKSIDELMAELAEAEGDDD